MTEQLIRPYGDTLDDGIVQLSFTLPVEHGPRARKAAELYVAKLNCEEIKVSHMAPMGAGFTFFVVYARATPSLDFAAVHATEVAAPKLGFAVINDLIERHLGRPVVVVGATIGTDAHTVGIDAIMNMKGYNHDYGLERYPQMRAHNLGAQVSPAHLVQKAVDVHADALLVSQTVTQRDAHLRNFTELVELLEAEGLRQRFVLVAGGPRVSHDLALELGYDAGFGPGTLPSHVASFVLERLLTREGKSLAALLESK